VSYGRLVDVYDRDPASGAGQMRLTDVPIGPSQPVSRGLALERDPAAGRDRLTVEHAFGTRAFDGALERAGELEPVTALVPRDAVLVLRFTDRVGQRHLVAGAVHVAHLGVPQDARVFADPTRPERLVIDPSVSELDAMRGGPGVGGLGGVGWPTAEVLELRSSGTLTTSFGSAGFLPALSPPRVVGAQPVDVLAVSPAAGGQYLVTVQYRAPDCLRRPTPGDVIQLAAAAVQVVAAPYAPNAVPKIGLARDVRVALIAGPASAVVPGAGEYRAPWDPSAGDPPECFVTVSPAPGAPPARRIRSDATFSVRFSQPMDPLSFAAFDTLTLARGNSANVGGPLERLVVGRVQASPSLERFTFVPELPLTTHTASSKRARYLFDLDGSTDGVRTLTGGELLHDLPAAKFVMDPNQPVVANTGVVLTFGSLDEDGDGSPELRGQFQHKNAEGLIRPRPLVRFSSVIDSSQASLWQKGAHNHQPWIDSPFSSYGAKMMSAWRYHDMGFTLLDENYHNLDVEGLHWAVDGGTVVPDAFAQFRMALAHSPYLPDEAISFPPGLPAYPSSGLVAQFDANVLDPLDDPLTVVHPKASGYSIDPSEAFTATSGTTMMPWPMNRGLPTAQYTYWTWRNTGLQTRGGPKGAGADTKYFRMFLGAKAGPFYPVDEVPTIGLPLLTEYRVYPDPSANALNKIAIVYAMSSSARPYFRSFSMGGVLSSGVTKTVDPDLEGVATGGVHPWGTTTAPLDDTLVFGQADFVVRVSRAHTAWFDAGASRSFYAPVLEPDAAQEPAGTQVVLAFRGATAMTGAGRQAWKRAENLDAYGESFTTKQHQLRGTDPNDAFTPTFFPGAAWTDDVGDLDGARYFQARITMISDPETGQTSTISALGVPYE
jgi:hypothetical protein